ncbi:MAG: lipoprotein insertase outer membrane protein LolB [Burkholderiales bacterium]|nr:lipoprotein insertase outer membrane protein LolB [Burkholderiales bacterium]GIK87767.1 MAG: hypothetical protein BroJett026_32480 [Betaproteobacteria bacterium]
MRAPRRRALVAAAALALSACAGMPPAPPAGAAFVPAADVPFEIAGRLSARHGDEGVAAGFRWRHAPGADELLLSTPVGGALARLDGDAGGVRMALADGRIAEDGDWDALTRRALGTPLPVRGLAWWVRASPRPGSAFTAEADAAGRLAVLRQDGWEIVYAYRGDETRPLRVVLAHPGVEVRLVVDAWLAG